MNEELRTSELEVSLNKISNKFSFYGRLSKSAIWMLVFFLLIQFVLVVMQDFSSALTKKMISWNSVSGLNMEENLFGVQDEKVKKKPKWSLQDMWNGQWQKQFETWFNTKMIPFRSTLIRFHNQFYYTFLWKSYMYSNGLAIGKKRYLYELSHINHYYNLHMQNFSPEIFKTWADELQLMADFFKKRGQHFIYIITPTKASYFPEYLPTCRRCTKKTRPAYYGYIAELKKRKFTFLDSSDSTLKAKQKFEHFMFPKGGTHWTSLAGAFATSDLMKEITKQYPLPEFNFQYTLNNKPRHTDMDLASLLNVFARPRHYVVPDVKLNPMVKKSKRPIKVAIISGSFMFEVANFLAQTKLFEQIDFFFYWKVDHYRNTPYTKVDPKSVISESMPYSSLGIDEKDPNAFNDILKADVVILEENEANLHSGHFQALLKKFVRNE